MLFTVQIDIDANSSAILIPVFVFLFIRFLPYRVHEYGELVAFAVVFLIDLNSHCCAVLFSFRCYFRTSTTLSAMRSPFFQFSFQFYKDLAIILNCCNEHLRCFCYFVIVVGFFFLYISLEAERYSFGRVSRHIDFHYCAFISGLTHITNSISNIIRHLAAFCMAFSISIVCSHWIYMAIVNMDGAFSEMYGDNIDLKYLFHWNNVGSNVNNTNKLCCIGRKLLH